MSDVDLYSAWTRDLIGPINPLGSLADPQNTDDGEMSVVVKREDYEQVAAELQRWRALGSSMRYGLRGDGSEFEEIAELLDTPKTKPYLTNPA